MITGTSPVRERWVDAAKGIAICLVVLFHSSMFLELVDLAGPWPSIVALLDTFRMPLFFFTAGLFARKAIGLRFSELWRRRVAKLVWVYGLWTLIWILVFRPLVGDVAAAEVQDVNPLVEWLLSFVLPNESTWFLWALAVYFLIAWAIRALPPVVQIGAAAVVSVLSTVPDIPVPPIEKSMANLVFFLLAVHLGTRVRQAAGSATWLVLGGVSAVYVVALLPIAKLDLLQFPGVKLMLGTLGVGFGIALAVAVTRAGIGGGMSALGARTLPIYLVHFYVAAGSAAIAAAFASTLAPWAVVLVPAVTAASIAISLVVHRLTRWVPGLWDLPRPWRPVGPRPA